MRKCSIILSVFNGSKFLKQQLDSLRKQTIQPDEVLIFDDGSTDDSVSFINKYIKVYGLNNWKLKQNNKNKGWAQNFFDGICLANYEYIFTCDQDDIWFPKKIEIMMKIMENKKDIDVLASKYILFKNDEELNQKFKNLTYNTKLYYPNFNKKFMQVKCPGCTYCIRSCYRDEIKKYWISGRVFAHDAFFWRFALMKGSLAIYNKPLIFWRQHNDSSFAKELATRRNLDHRIHDIDNWIIFNLQLSKYLDSKGNIKYKRKILNRNKDMFIARKNFLTSFNINEFIKITILIPYYTYFKEYGRDVLIGIKKWKGKYEGLN